MHSPTRRYKADSHRIFNYILVFLLLLSVVSALYAAALFHSPSKDMRELEITVRYSDVEIFAARAGLTIDETLRYLKERGVTSIGVAEYYLWKLRRDPGCYVLSNLELAGELSYNPELFPYREFLEDAVLNSGLSFGDYVVFMPAGSWADQVWEHLQELYEVELPGRFKLEKRAGEGMALYLIKGATYDNLTHLSLGAKPQELERIAATGLFINPYLSERRIETAATAEQMLSTYDNYPLSAAVFEGGRVPGDPSFLRQTAEALQKRGIPGVIYEYSQFPQGMEKLAALLDYNLLVMRPGKAVDRPETVINGIRERRVQLLELAIRNYLPQSGGEDLRERLSLQLELLLSELERNGYTPGKAQVLVPQHLPGALYAAMAAGVISLLLLLLRAFFNWKPIFKFCLLLLGLLFVCILLSWNAVLAGQTLSLFAALLFPRYCALLLFFSAIEVSALTNGDVPLHPALSGDGAGVYPLEKTNPPARRKALPKTGGLILRSLARVLLIFLLSLAGGLLVHGLLTAPPFFHGMELFRGVKLMYSLPLGLAVLAACAILAFMESGGPTAGTANRGQIPEDRASRKNFHKRDQRLQDYQENTTEVSHIGERKGAGTAGFCGSFSLFPPQLSRERKSAFFGFLRRLLKRPVTLGDLILLAAILAVAYFYLTRTGHVLEISSIEDALRGGLERLFGVRPRFKEFALGYPLAILGLYLLGSSASTKRIFRILAFAFLAAGTLAPISVVNTFAHITAPTGLSLLRSIHGFWLGCLGGLILIFIWKGVALLLTGWQRQRNKKI